MPFNRVLSFGEITGSSGNGSGAPLIDPQPDVATCDFIGFSSGDNVNNAYAGGTSSGGVSRANLGVRFTGAVVLNTWNGCCSPSAATAYAPSGTMTVGSTSSYWTGIDFYSSNSQTITVQTFDSTDGTGAALQTFTYTANVTGSSYSTWTLRHLVFATQARSVKIVSAANSWGIDDLLPSFIPPSPPALTITSNAGACTAIGNTVSFDLTLTDVPTAVVAGQISLAWDPSKLTPAATNPISAGDAPFVVYHSINASAGTATILVSITPGTVGAPVISKVVARLRFTAAATSCNGSGTSVGFFPSTTLPTEFTDGAGGSVRPQLNASSTFVVDDGQAPVFSNVPAPVTVQAQAGEGNFAYVSLTAPTATDPCTGSSGVTSSRSDGQPLSAAYPVGTTTVTWSASDTCGNTRTANTAVTVQALNTINISASWVNPFGNNVTRSVSVTLQGSGAAVSRTVNAVVASNGNSSFSITDLPVNNYFCGTLEDPARSLRRRMAVTDGGSVWVAGTVQLVLGDIIADEVIDVLDWGAYVVNNPNADLNSDGAINSTDGNIILANFGQLGDALCAGAPEGQPSGPVVAISVEDLVAVGLPELVAADLNHDGWLDMKDVEFAGH